MKAYLLLGGVFLVVTGGEALYADIGHFGKKPIRISWFCIALPALLLNYFGQGANLILHPEAIANPFYMLSASWFYIPLLIISTLATIIASQSVITATFSLTKQAILLGLAPRLTIKQTSEEMAGQIYIPQMNIFLCLGTLLLLFTFKTSSALAQAYGIAVNLVMLSVTCMVTYAALKIWNWSYLKVLCIFGVFLLIDLAFLGANAHKFITGGWLPISFALFIATIMFTWNTGMQYLQKNFYMKKESLAKIIKQLQYKSSKRVPGITSIFITDIYDQSGGSFLRFLKISLTVPENILIVSYKVGNKPRVSQKDRFEIHLLDEKICQVTLLYGFMDNISIPYELSRLNQEKKLPFHIQVDDATYLVEIPNVLATKDVNHLTFFWQERLFAFLMRNYSANLDIAFYKLPYDRTLAIGTYCVI
jgi:KUP system potassium uptake protein